MYIKLYGNNCFGKYLYLKMYFVYLGTFCSNTLYKMLCKNNVI